MTAVNEQRRERANIVYRFQRQDAMIEIEGNQGTMTFTASSARDALLHAHDILPQIREVGVRGTAGRYLVDFKVDFDYNRSASKKAHEVAQLDLTHENYERLAPDEKYMALLHAQLTGKEIFLGDKPIAAALMSLKNEMVRRGEIPSHDDFMDYDIAVYNLVESQSS
jgi:hypothetical protein